MKTRCPSVPFASILAVGRAAVQRQAGPVLNAAITSFIAVLSTATLFFAAFQGKKDLQTYVLLALFFGSSASYMLIMAFSLGRLLVTENGILAGIKLLEWNRIDSYHWQGDEEPKLVLKMRRRFFRRNPLSVPLDDRDAVAELLQSYLPGCEARGVSGDGADPLNTLE